jgi:hypothetical protein
MYVCMYIYIYIYILRINQAVAQGGGLGLASTARVRGVPRPGPQYRTVQAPTSTPSTAPHSLSGLRYTRTRRIPCPPYRTVPC